MKISREKFLNQFASTILVRGTQRWDMRHISPPEWLPGSIYDAMCVCNGRFSVSRKLFYDAIWPLVVATHDVGRKGKIGRPDPSEFADRLYDVLTQAGIEVAIGPPVKAHGHRFGQRPNAEAFHYNDNEEQREA